MNKKLLSIWGFLLIIIIIFLIISYFLLVPKMLKAEGVMINSEAVDFKSERDRIISYVRDDNTILSKGDVILVYDNLANYKSVLYLDSLLKKGNEVGLDVLFFKTLKEELLIIKNKDFGEILTKYIEFENQLSFFLSLNDLELYDLISIQSKIELVNKSKSIDSDIFIDIKSKLEFFQKNYVSDSILFAKRLISIDELTNSKNNYIQTKITYNNIFKQQVVESNNTILLKNEKQKVLESRNVELAIEYNKLIEKYVVLFKGVQEWKHENLIISPKSGRLKFYKYWKSNDYARMGEQLFAVVDNEAINEIEVKINIEGIGDIQKGQNCLIELKEYPAVDYGMLNAKVESVIYLSHLNKENKYVTFLKLILVNGAITNKGKKLELRYSMPVNAQIIINNESLFNKIFKRIKIEN